MVELFRWQSLVDFVVLSAGFYVLLIWARATRALRLALAIVSFHVVALVARHFDLVITGWVLDGVSLGGLALVVILFQGEIRHALMNLDDLLRLGIHPRAQGQQVYRTLAEAAFGMAAARVGALMILPRENSIQEMVKGGIPYGADVSKPVLESVFQKNSPLHDGAAIIEGKTISQVGVVLPLTEREAVPVEFGTRHRAGMGVAERCDALVIVVSEERGIVSLMQGHIVQPMASPALLVEALERAQSSRKESLGARLRGLLITNLRYRLAAAGLSAFLLTASMLGTRTTVKMVSAPIEFRNVPSGMEIARQSPMRLDVQLRGSPWLMDSVLSSGLVARFDMTGASAGLHELPVSSDTLNVPPGVVVEQVIPESVTVRIVNKMKEPAR